MNRLFNIGYAVFFAALAFRWHTVTSDLGLPFFSEPAQVDIKFLFLPTYMSELEIICYGIALVWCALALFNSVVLEKCRRCKSYNLQKKSEEIDRWVGPKNVRESTGNSTVTRSITTTFVQMKNLYRCNNCGYCWETTHKAEKT